MPCQSAAVSREKHVRARNRATTLDFDKDHIMKPGLGFSCTRMVCHEVNKELLALVGVWFAAKGGPSGLLDGPTHSVSGSSCRN